MQQKALSNWNPGLSASILGCGINRDVMNISPISEDSFISGQSFTGYPLPQLGGSLSDFSMDLSIQSDLSQPNFFFGDASVFDSDISGSSTLFSESTLIDPSYCQTLDMETLFAPSSSGGLL